MSISKTFKSFKYHLYYYSITSFGFENLKFLILSKIDGIGNIEKTIIFINSVEKSIALEIYLQILLPDNLKDRDDNIIKSFSSILEAKIKTNWLKYFFNGNTRIIFCMDATEMRLIFQI